jgi:hypothetical protein
MSTNGILNFQNTNKIIFGGSDSNVVIDTSNVSLGIGIQGTETPGSNLHVVGNAFISSNLKLTTDTSILVNSNVVTDFSGPHGRLPKVVPLKKYPEIVFEEGKFDSNESTNTYVQAGYTVSASSSNPPTYSPIKAFNGIISGDDAWTVSGSPYQDETGGDPGAYNAGTYSTDVFMPTSTSIPGEYIQIKLPYKIKPTKFGVASYSIGNDSLRQPNSGVFAGSNDGTTWYKLVEYSGETSWTRGAFKSFIVTDNIDSTYEYVRFIIRRVGNHGDHTGVTLSDGSLSIHGLEIYGYEEDPPAGDISVDTTFTSIMNTPQTTGANVYVDGSLGETFTNRVTGPTPVGTATTHDNTNKYWEMNGQLTSNITVEANTFLEGDQPHAVSVWFNSSNLEANVSNTCVFSISDQEHLNSQNLDLQSNTWHNLTYSYQGEGGSRVAYLDGRKVAEDQAEDTFGEYPPFAMTGYAQGGYVVSSSREYVNVASGGTFPSWHCFNKSSSDAGSYIGLDYAYNGLNGIYTANGGPLKNLGTASGSSATIDGEYVIIEMPHKLKLSYVNVKERGSQTTHAPGDGKIYGSHDGFDWVEIASFSGLTYNNIDTAYTPITVNADTAYEMFAFVVSKNAGYAGYSSIGELRYYGHRENDLVRLPDPTNVLKYPHIAMTGPAQRGYVVTASASDSDVGGTHPGRYDLYQPHSVFDDITSTEWLGKSNRYDSSGDHIAGQTTFETSNTWTGDWLQIQLPHKIRLTSTKIARQLSDVYGTNRSPRQGAILGSNDSTNGWQYIHNWSGIGASDWPSGGVHREFIFTTPSNAYYKYYRFIIEKTQTDGYTSIGSWQLFGTGVDSIPIQIGGGNIDKVANFRVYDQFVGEDQALEIWDAQKDEFGRAKSSMTLQKGRLGIGTTEPQGRLAVLDEPHNLEEFPPRGIPSTGPITPGNSKVNIDGHGTYEVLYSVSDPSHNNSATDNPLVLFDKNPNSGVYSQINTFVLNSAGTTGSAVGSGNPLADPAIYTGSSTHGDRTYKSLGGYGGIWYGLKFPYKVNLNEAYILPRDDSVTVTPNTAVFLGSEDGGVTWTKIGGFSGASWVAYKYNEYTLSHTKPINAVAMVITHSNHYYAANLGEIKFFGTREQGQSVLHDGQLTLTKSLNVPRIGPALDADDTPRRDRLVVEYNTSTNQATGTDPTFDGVVRDTSGRGNDGVYYRRAAATNTTGGYNATEKAFEFASYGTPEQHIQTPKLKNPSGNWVFSVSCWFKANSLHTGGVWQTNPGGTDIAAGVQVRPDGTLRIFVWGTTIGDFAGGYSVGDWVHVVALFKGAGQKGELFINGSSKVLTNNNSPLNLSGDNRIYIGSQADTDASVTSPFHGFISNFKLYDTALTAEEVKTLYYMGRNGSVANPQPLHIAAPLYSPGTIVQVESSTMIETWSSSLASDANIAAATFLDIEGMSVKIHPKFSNSKFLISYHANIGTNGHVVLRLKRTHNGVDTFIAQPTAGQNRMEGTAYCHARSSNAYGYSLEHLDSPGNDTGDITYQLVAHSKRGDAYFILLNRSYTDGDNEYYGRASSTITVKEICQ